MNPAALLSNPGIVLLVGSWGVSWVSHLPEFIDIEMR
jgi:hypothetical protein